MTFILLNRSEQTHIFNMQSVFQVQHAQLRKRALIFNYDKNYICSLNTLLESFSFPVSNIAKSYFHLQTKLLLFYLNSWRHNLNFHICFHTKPSNDKKLKKKLNISSKTRKVIWTEMPKIIDWIWLTRIIPSARSYSFLQCSFSDTSRCK